MTCSQDSDVFYAMYNDQPPPKPAFTDVNKTDGNAEYGHTKGQ